MDERVRLGGCDGCQWFVAPFGNIKREWVANGNRMAVAAVVFLLVAFLRGQHGFYEVPPCHEWRVPLTTTTLGRLGTAFRALIALFSGDTHSVNNTHGTHKRAVSSYGTRERFLQSLLHEGCDLYGCLQGQNHDSSNRTDNHATTT